MKKYSVKLLLSFSVVVIYLLSTVNISYAAAGSADLSITGSTVYLGSIYAFTVCNGGDETVTSFTLDVQSTNYQIKEYFVLPQGNGSGTTTSTPGTYDSGTGVWNGVIANTQCVNVAVYGDITVPVGGTTSLSISITQSELQGSIANVDPNNANDTTYIGPTNVITLPDFAINTRLLTTGTIQAGTQVSYETTISNVGEGSSPSNETLALAFIVPDAASFTSVTDSDTNDRLDITSNPGCFPFGPPSNAGSGLAGYSGEIVVCVLQPNADIQPGDSFPFIFNMNATSSFASGAVTVYGFISGTDTDSLLNQVGLLRGDDTFSLLSNMNNLVRLQYDPDALTVTINRCAGQSAVTTNGNGCFTVTFNKLIWEPSFTRDDLVLSGGGSVSGFTKVNDYTWRVDVTGITPGSVLRLTLGDKSVQDYSAVQNGVQVLGENEIRYESAGSNGSLPKTGADSTTVIVSIIMIGIGFILIKKSKRRSITA
ncbi:MAG: LPXTG cell wall anchor domain-containing protein [Acidimicrobiia bacterium]